MTTNDQRIVSKILPSFRSAERSSLSIRLDAVGDGNGLQNAFKVAAPADSAQVLTFLVYLKWGEGMRRWSVGRYR